MKSINKSIFSGCLGKDPESKFTTDGTLIVTASIAVSDPVKKGEEWDNKTYWVNLTAWRTMGEALQRYSKGDNIYVETKMSIDKYEKEGQKRESYKFTLTANPILISKGKNSQTQDDHQEPEYMGSQVNSRTSRTNPLRDDKIDKPEIPF